MHVCIICPHSFACMLPACMQMSIYMHGAEGWVDIQSNTVLHILIVMYLSCKHVHVILYCMYYYMIESTTVTASGSSLYR